MSMKILGIETSCDETSVAIVEDGRRIISDVVHTQSIHAKFGGVVPEVASRNHVVKIHEILDEALRGSGNTLEDMDAFAVTYGPGLVGALLIGLNTAKSLAYAVGRPLIPVNHVEAHLYANILHYGKPDPPFLGLIVSGGHTTLFLVKGHHDYAVIGRTRDDAVGEAYDKVSKMLGLGYPGGPVVDSMAASGDEDAVQFKIPVPRDSFYDFSFSGLKTAVKNYYASHPAAPREDICASFQKTAIKALTMRVEKYMREHGPLDIAVAGGVAANSRLRAEIAALAEKFGVASYIPPVRLCTDNAAMVASLGYYLFQKGDYLSPEESLKLNAFSSLPL